MVIPQPCSCRNIGDHIFTRILLKIITGTSAKDRKIIKEHSKLRVFNTHLSK